MHSPDLTQDNIARIRELFPHCVAEAHDNQGRLTFKVDFDMLRQELSADLVEGPQERYCLNWPGKRQAMLTANAPIAKSLRPCREESVDFDTTENLYIEGDNLEVLKLLQESYLGKVKMIYIDPPYNTGNDFIYKDDFAEEAEEFLRRDGQYDDGGDRMEKLLKSDGRFHSHWLSMMYQRLRITRNLLTDGGVIFISIDDNEAHNLRKICDEIYGGDNFISIIIWHNNKKGRQMDKHIKSSYENLFVYSRNELSIDFTNKRVEIDIDKYDLTDDISSYRKGYPLHNGTANFHINNRPNLAYTIYYNNVTQEAKIVDEKIGNPGSYTIQISDEGRRYLAQGYIRIIPKKNEKYGTQRVWRWGSEKFIKEYKTELMFVKEDSSWYFYQKERIDEDGTKTQKYTNYIDIDTSVGKNELNELFDNKAYFEFPKSAKLVGYLANMITRNDDIILDFFSGSATTAHAVMQLNAEDNGKRKFIMVQWPEACPPDSEAAKAGYRNICEIGKERIRRAGKKIKSENPLTTQDLDIGFRVLKAQPSCMTDIYYTPDETRQQHLRLFDNIKPDATPEDLLFQALTDWGVELHLPIAPKTIKGKKVFFVDHNSLAACFDAGVNEDFIKELAAHKPLRVVFRDAGFANDAARINAEQIFRQLSPDTEVRVL